MTDWADEIADRFGDQEISIASALRKAKADGMREGVRMVGNVIVGSIHSFFDSLERGAQIEKGDP